MLCGVVGLVDFEVTALSNYLVTWTNTYVTHSSEKLYKYIYRYG